MNLFFIDQIENKKTTEVTTSGWAYSFRIKHLMEIINECYSLLKKDASQNE
jgi:hypothetical protein